MTMMKTRAARKELDEDNNGTAPPPKNLSFVYSLNVGELYDRISGASRYLGYDDGSDDGRRVTVVLTTVRHLRL